MVHSNELIKIYNKYNGKSKYNWNYYSLSRNPNITKEFIDKHFNENWDKSQLFLNRNISWENMIIYIDNKSELSNEFYENPNITWNIIKSNPNINWNYKILSKHPNITWNIVKNNPDKPWDYLYLSSNLNITWDIVMSNSDKPWDFRNLSKNPNITWDIVQSNPDKPWNYTLLSLNPNITWDNIKNNPDKRWNYYTLSKHPNITWDIVKENLDKNWNFSILVSRNPNITWDIIKNNDIFHTQTYYKAFCENPNITLEIIDNYPFVYVSFYNLSDNLFLYHPYYISPFYKKKLVKSFLDTCKEELIAKVCTPKRILNWNENVLLDKNHPFYGYTQKEIDLLM